MVRITTFDFPIRRNSTSIIGNSSSSMNKDHTLHHDTTESSSSSSSSSTASCNEFNMIAEVTAAVATSTSTTITSSSCPEVTTIEQYENTMKSLVNAMTELQMELREKTDECEVLYETTHNLSNALEVSDTQLYNQTVQYERLLMKLQMITFSEYNVTVDEHRNDLNCMEDNNNTRQSKSYQSTNKYSQSVRKDPIPIFEPRLSTNTTTVPAGSTQTIVSSTQRPPQPEIINHRSYVKNSTRSSLTTNASNVGTSISRPVCVDDIHDDHNDDDDEDDDDDHNDEHEKEKERNDRSIEEENTTETSDSNNVRRPVCVDDGEKFIDTFLAEPPIRSSIFLPINKTTSNTNVTTTNNNTTTQNNNKNSATPTITIGPSQAHFYNVIRERDQYKQKNIQLINDLRLTKCKLQDHKNKLRQMKALLELAYSNNNNNNNNKSESSNKNDNKRYSTNIRLLSSKQQQLKGYTVTAKARRQQQGLKLDTDSSNNNIKQRRLPIIYKVENNIRTKATRRGQPTSSSSSTTSWRHHTTSSSSSLINPSNQHNKNQQNSNLVSTNSMKQSFLLDEMIHKNWNEKEMDSIGSTSKEIEIDTSNNTETTTSPDIYMIALLDNYHDDADRAGGSISPNKSKIHSPIFLPSTKPSSARSLLFDI